MIVNDIVIGGNNPLVFIGGPCVIEEEEIWFESVRELKRITDEVNMPFILKSSYRKANRFSIGSVSGPGIDKGLEILKRTKEELKISLTSDVHSPQEVNKVKDILDVIQIPALLCRQVDLIEEAAKTGKPINIKKGQTLSPEDMGKIVERAERYGNHNVLITERGTLFGYNNLIVDMKSFVKMREFDCPIVFDASHPVQKPGKSLPSKKGPQSEGEPKFVPVLAKAATAVGIDAIFIETHKSPLDCGSDAFCMLPLDQLPPLLKTINKINQIIK